MTANVTISTFQLMSMFPDEPAARDYLEARRWPNGVCCPTCGVAEKIVKRGGKRAGYYRCPEGCGEFTVRTGTIFERSHVSLRAWCYSMYLLVTARKGISSLQLSKQIGVTPKTAGFVIGRLRAVIGDAAQGVEYCVIAEWPAYRVGSDGSAWSRWRLGPGAAADADWRRMNPTRDRDGYTRIDLRAKTERGWLRRSRKVCVLVCEAFHGPRPPEHEVRHLDGDAANDAADNLTWGTSLENHADKRRHGTIARGLRLGKIKLTDAQIAEILALKGAAYQREVAAQFGVARGYIGQIWTAGGRPT